jgi:hypothetical protein
MPKNNCFLRVQCWQLPTLNQRRRTSPSEEKEEGEVEVPAPEGVQPAAKRMHLIAYCSGQQKYYVHQSRSKHKGN